MKIITALLAICITGSIALAQTPSMKPESDNLEHGQATAPDQSTVKPQTVRGCLNSVGDNYTITDQVSGKTFKLEGSTDRLKQYIGQTVEITGSVKSIDDESRPASAPTGDILTLSDVKQLSDKCSAAPSKGALTQAATVLLAALQLPVNADANTQLDSSAQMSSNAADTSQAASRTRSVTTNTQEHGVIRVTGQTGPHGLSVNTADTTSVGRTTPPADSAEGYAHKQNPNDQGPATIDKQAKQGAGGPDQRLPAPNPAAIGSMPGDGERAAVAASSAEMHTDTSTNKTTFRTERKSEANTSSNPNPKELQPPSDDVKTETTPTPPQ
jgi:hypothetical protein